MPLSAHNPSLSPDRARWLVASWVRGVGIGHDSVGGSRDPVTSETHAVLIGVGVWVAEEPRVSPEARAQPRPVVFMVLPNQHHHHSGAFFRPGLVRDEGDSGRV